MATPAVGTVLFQRGQCTSGSENELWDDTALIKAYDNAVKVMKAKLNDNGEESVDMVQSNTHHRKKKNSKRKRNKSKKKKWNSGDQCRAVFTEDNLVYDAEILTVDHVNNTCVVRYRGYGNEEEQDLSALLPPTGRNQKPRNPRVSDVETDSMDWSGQSPAPKAKSKNPRSNMGASSNPMYAWPGNPAFPPFAGMPTPQFQFPSMPNYPGFPHPGFQHPTGLPTMPPPPPPINNDVIEGDNEALCSMLMSWYMSGYHTGYYQGLKQAKQCGASTQSDSGR